MTRKPRADSVLKTLSPARQERIVDHALGHTLAETVAWLRDDGLKTSSAALSEFLSWYRLRQRLSRNQSVVETLLTDLRRDNPKIDPDELFKIGQSFFSALAIEQQDPDAWARTIRTDQRAQALELEARRVSVLEQKASQADQAAAVTGDTSLTPEQKQQKFREIFGIA